MKNTTNKLKNQEEKIDKFNYKKTNNLKLAILISKHLTEKGILRFKDCATWITLISNSDFENKKVLSSNYCCFRFCPICTWIKSKKDGSMIKTMMKYINKIHKKEFIFITLTSVNVTDDLLISEINKFNICFEKLIKRKSFKIINKGYIRKLEVTYNRIENTYNPHFHVIMAVDKSYFKSRNYIKQELWLENWKELMDDERITQLDVRRVNKTGSGSNAINEIAKYSAKDSDFLESEKVFDVIYKALKGRQLITYNGLFKDAVSLYKSKDKETNLDKYKEIDNTEYTHFFKYIWNKKYEEVEKRELGDDEYEKFNNQWLN